MAEYFTQKCEICEKEIVTHGAKNWGYKIKKKNEPYKFFCSYKCQRKWEAEHPEKKVDVIAQAAAEDAAKPKKTPQDRGVAAQKLAAEIRAGGDPIKWLEKNGYRNAYQAYDAIRHYCETKMPEMTEVLRPIKELRKAEVRKVDKVPDIEQLEEQVAEMLNAEVKPKGGTFRYQVTGIETNLGKFQWSRDPDVITFTYEREEISMLTWDWQQLAEQLPEVLGVMGVEE